MGTMRLQCEQQSRVFWIQGSSSANGVFSCRTGASWPIDGGNRRNHTEKGADGQRHSDVSDGFERGGSQGTSADGYPGSNHASARAFTFRFASADAGQVNVENRASVVLVDTDAIHAGSGDAGVVESHVDAPEPLPRPIGQRLDVGTVLIAGELVGPGLRCAVIDVGPDHLGAIVG